MRIVASNTTHLSGLYEALAFFHPLHMRCHDHLILRTLVLRHKNIHDFRKFHTWMKIEKSFTVVQYSNSLQVAALTHVVL